MNDSSSDTGLDIQVEPVDDLLVIVLRGKLDSFTSKNFEDRIIRLIKEGRSSFVVDGSELEYVSSAGLRVFYLASHHLEENDGKLIFCAINKSIRKVFDIVDLSSEFEIVDTRQEAIAKLHRSRVDEG